MQTAASHFPNTETLTRGLTSVFNRNVSARGPLTVVRREPCIYASTFPSEIVTCLLGEGSKLRLLCKYAGRHFYTGHGHRGGIPYEAEVYRQVLQPSKASTPAFFGTHTDSKTRSTWLVLEYLDNNQRVSKPRRGMVQAARWIGRFHAIQEVHLSASPIPRLNKYDAKYYRGWVRRTSLFAGRLHGRFPWLALLCRRFHQVIPLLLAAPPTVIHGEYYPHNILSQAGVIRPVDWESAAIGPGEIDLASLTDGWPAATVRRCEMEYQRARWPQGAPADFGRTLSAARLYMSFRWLGDERESTTRKELRRYFLLVRSLGEQLGLI